MNVLGISGLHRSCPFKQAVLPGLSPRDYRIVQGFDAAAAIVTSDGVRAAAAEERFTREKTTGSFPVHAIRWALAHTGLEPGAIDRVAHGFAYEPHREFFAHDDFSRRQFEEVYSLEAQLQVLEDHLPGYGWRDKFVAVPHHLAHAASTFYLSGFDEALILVTDGMGEMHSATIAVGAGNDIEVLTTIPALHSLGILYGIITMYLGFEMNLDEYKVMGLAPYGDSRRHFAKLMEFIHLRKDGTYTIPLLSKDRTLLEKETHSEVLRALADELGPARIEKGEMTQNHIDVAAGMQAALQATLMHTLRHFKKQTGQHNLCLAGGVALNCTANGVIQRSRTFRGMFVQPAAGDDGSALGAALYVQRQAEPRAHNPRMAPPLWGPQFTDAEIAAAIAANADCVATRFETFEELAEATAQCIADGKIVSWFQGQMEFGPRALGNRSILADPRPEDMRDRINAIVKKREGFRPFAPAVLASKAAEYFEIEAGSEPDFAHMLYVIPVRDEYRASLPSITHVDGSARVQTVTADDNPRFCALLEAVGKKTGMPILLNTSFNVKGQPIVCNPTEAVETFLFAGLDALAIGNHLVVRR